VPDERLAIRDEILRWNGANSLGAGIIAEPVMWETHSMPSFGAHPQKLINKQIVEWCDMVIACFWATAGSPTDTTESGTIEEIEETVKRGRPAMIYFCTRSLPQKHDRAQWDRLVAFKDKCKKQSIYSEFADIPDLRSKVGAHLQARLRLQQVEASASATRRPDFDGWEVSEAVDSGRDDWVGRLEGYSREFEYSWKDEMESAMPNTEQCQYFASRLHLALVSLASSLGAEAEKRFGQSLRGVMKLAKDVEKHQLSLDGGVSYKALVAKGDDLIAQLKALVASAQA
jgi:hypothetical protein